MASSLSKQAPNTWAPLEDIFQNRVAKANEKLGIPSQEAFEALNARVAQLEKMLNAGTSTQSKSTTTRSAKTTRSKA
jgi:hypothetical protein